MYNKTNNRRQFVKDAATGLGLLTLPGLLQAKQANGLEKKKVVCVGAHPDDPESGCGGTLAKLANEGHDVTVIYLTTGEAGITGKTHNEAAAIRKQEAINACKILNAKPIFAGQVDGDTVVNNDWVIRMQKLIVEEKPAIVFTHWPLDSHKDHQVASLLTIQVWLRIQQPFPVYFFEVCTGEQSLAFHPTDYIDISAVQEQKRKAVFCHLSQDPPGIYECGHSAMEAFRGKELNVKAGEAFVRLAVKQNGNSDVQALF